MMRSARWTAALLVGALAIALAACGAGPAEDALDGTLDSGAARPLTTEEAQSLATLRFRNFDAGARAVSFTVEDDLAATFDGWFDYGSHVGYGSLRQGEVDELLIWNDQFAGTRPSGGGTSAPLPPPDTDADATEAKWSGGALAPGSSRRDAVLAIVASLGQDRPENPLLLQQTGALWLGEETVEDVTLTIFAGPVSDEALPAGETADPDAAATKYWVDATGLLPRADIRLGGEEAWTRISFADAGDVRLDDPFAGARS